MVPVPLAVTVTPAGSVPSLTCSVPLATVGGVATVWALSPVAGVTLTPLMACAVFFFFNDTATTEIYALSLHDALPIFATVAAVDGALAAAPGSVEVAVTCSVSRSAEHTSELQPHLDIVCRLLL